MADKVVSATIKINDAFSGTLGKLKSQVSSAAAATKGLGGAAGSGTGMFKSMLGATVIGSGITAGIGAAKNAVVSLVGELNESKTAWDTFSGNMKIFGRANQIPKVQADLQDFAQKSIYSASDMASTYSQLAAVGTKNTTALVKGFGGLAASASDPKQAMKTLSQQATQMAAKPKVQWQDFKLMMEQTSGGMAAVAKDMGMPARQLVKEVQDGKIKTDDFFNSIARVGTNKGFTKLATTYKTIPEALAGMTETLSGKLKKPWEQVSSIGIKAITQLTDKLQSINFNKVASNLISFGATIGGALKTIAPAILPAVGAFLALKGAVSGINVLGNLGNGLMAAESSVKTFASTLSAIPTSIGSSFMSIGSILSVAFSPIGLILIGVTALIAAAVVAWKTNFMGVRDFLTNLFSNLGTAFAPLVNAFNQLKTALGPLVSSLLPMLGSVLAGIGVGTIVSIAMSVAVLVDGFTNLIAVAGAVVHAIGAVSNGMQALGSAMVGDFSGAGQHLKDAKADIDGIGDSLQNLGSHAAISSVVDSLSMLDSKASSTKSNLSNIQVTPKLNTTNVFGQLDSLTANKTANVNVKPTIQAGANPFAQIQQQADSHPVKAKVTTEQTIGANPLQKLQQQATESPIKAKVTADTSGASDVASKIQSQVTNRPIKAKVATPTVPTPKMPAGQTMHVKVAQPVVPTPKMPTMPTIPAPHIARPSTAGLVAAMHSGVAGMVAAARSGSTQLASAVRAGVNSAVAAARSGAGAMRSAGTMIGAGLAAGMRSQVGAVAAAANALVAQANKAARAAASIHSPSRLFAEIGDYMGQGMAVGMNGTQALVAGAGSGLSNAAANGASGSNLAIATPGYNASNIPAAGTFSSQPGSTASAFGAPTSTMAGGNQSAGNTTSITFGDIIIQGTGKLDYDGPKLLATIEEELMKTSERQG